MMGLLYAAVIVGSNSRGRVGRTAGEITTMDTINKMLYNDFRRSIYS